MKTGKLVAGRWRLSVSFEMLGFLIGKKGKRSWRPEIVFRLP
jgi:hypothetical protein